MPRLTFIPIMLSLSLGCESALSSAELELTVQEPSRIQRSQWPVTSGIPLAQGALYTAESAALFDTSGREQALQTETLARWPDGSIRWLLLDFAIDLKAAERKTLVLRYGPGIKRSPVPAPLRLEHKQDGLMLTTGPLQVAVSSRQFRPLDAVWLDSNRDGQFAETERLTDSHNAGIVLRTPGGKTFRGEQSPAQITVEQSGPLRACLRITGKHAAAQGHMFGYIVRMHVFRGQPFVKLEYTFVNDNRQQLMSKVDALELVFRTRHERDEHGLLGGRLSGSSRLFQIDDQRFEIDGKAAGKRSAGWAALGTPRGGVAVGVRDFWQNWPKSLETGPGEMRIGICPQFPKGLYDGRPVKEECKLYYYLRDGVYTFKMGTARTHELWTTFYSDAADADALGRFFRATQHPLLAQSTPAHVSASLALGDFPPADARKFARYDAWLNALFQQHLSDREQVREYGLLNYGDWYNIKWDSWGNLEYDTAHCFFVQYLRTGDRRYFDRAAQAAVHLRDVDVVHAVGDKLHEFPGSANMRPGHVWLHQVGHTGGYYGRYVDGKYHDIAPLIMTGPYQLGMYNYGHQWIAGVFDHYFLTGNRRALEVARMTSDTIAEACPTRYSDHIRDVGWPFNLVIAAYEATGDKVYLAAADRQWERLKAHWNPQKGWPVMLAYGHCSAPGTAERCRGQNAYMLGLTLSGLARYHRISQNPEVLQALSSGIEQLIRECWSEHHRSFYLTSCTHTRDNPPPALCSATALAAEAFAYESLLTGNAEHRRIFAAAFQTMVDAGLKSVARGDQHGQTGYASMMFHFTPYGLRALAVPEPRKAP
ncbi:MAG: hypothetical protein ABGZ17_27180 [Planctomycetaceae bacterium]